MSDRKTLDDYAHAMAKLCNDHAAEKRRIAARIREIAGSDSHVWEADLIRNKLFALADELEGK